MPHSGTVVFFADVCGIISYNHVTLCGKYQPVQSYRQGTYCLNRVAKKPFFLGGS